MKKLLSFSLLAVFALISAGSAMAQTSHHHHHKNHHKTWHKHHKTWHKHHKHHNNNKH